MDECPRIHFKRNQYRVGVLCRAGKNERTKEVFQRNENREKDNFLGQCQEILESVLSFREENKEVIELYDQIVEEEEDYFFYMKKAQALEREVSVLSVQRSSTA